MKEEIIQQVKAAEDRAEQHKREAQEEAEKILHNARHQAVELRMEIVEAARNKTKQLFEQGVKNFEIELDAVRQRFDNEIAGDKAHAQQMFESVVEFVVTTFQERLGI